MKKILIFLLAIVVLSLNSCSNKIQNDFIFVKGGTFKNTKTNYNKTQNAKVKDFYISKYEITQKDWIDVMGSNPSKFKNESLPVETVNWYECIEYCNKRSLKEGLKKYYTIDKERRDLNNTNSRDDMKWTVTINSEADGYRLPTEMEWEYAASGGQKSKNYTYSGDNDINIVAWYWQNSGDKFLKGDWNWATVENNNSRSKSVGVKKPNELGIFDMSGNLREWCFEWYGELGDSVERGSKKVWKGGGWMGSGDCCKISYRGSYEPNNKSSDQGFRVCK